MNKMKKIISALIVIMLTALLAVSASAKTVLKGDFDMNGRITASDARAVLRAGARIDNISEDGILICDMDDNGRITAADARLILRIAASLDTSDKTVEIGEENGSGDDNTERTELSGGFGLSTEDFIKKFGGMREVDTKDGTTEYTNDYVTIISDPDMIYAGCVNSISITGGDYMLCGVYTGMSSSQAVKTLTGSNWRISDQSETQVILEQNAMRMKIAVAGGTITFAEYYLGFSLVNPNDDETTKKPDETTTQAPEPTTKPDDTTTQPPETTTKPDETTTSSGSTDKIPSGNDDFNALPYQIKAYLIGEFSFDGFRYEKNEKTPVSMAFSGGNVKASMSDQMSDGSTMKIEMLIDNSGSKQKIYFVNSTKMEYVDSSMLLTFLGIDAASLDVGYSAVDINTIAVETSQGKINNTDCTVYSIDTGEESCDIYMYNEEIKRIINYDSVGNIKSQMDIAIFRDVNSSEVSIKSYKKGTLLSVMGFSMSDLM